MKNETDARDPRASSLLVEAQAPEAGGVALLGLPFDSSIPSRPGARQGPKAFREALSTLTTFDGARDLAGRTCADLGDLDLPPTSVRRAHARVEQASRAVFEAGAIPFFIGGDNGLTGALIRGLAAARPDLRLGLIVIDSHYDVREYDDEDSLSSGTPYRRALETAICEGSRTAILGTRSWANSAWYHRWALERGIHLLPVETFDEQPASAVAESVLDRIAPASDAIFLSIDIDAVGSGEAPGSSAAHPGGLRAREAVALVRRIARSPKLIGADLSELSPPWDVQGMTAKLAARLFLEVWAGIAFR
ncbi:MAG TPA: agmatinase family protein [Thermoanaerobaculia bacterium]|nr:agmatinase family protein [Thermoanaerobaculia bacterium]